MDSVLKQTIINKFRTGSTLLQLAEEYGFTEIAMKKLLIPRPVSKITAAVITTRIMEPDEQKKAIQKRAGRKAAATKKANKLKAAALGVPPPTKKKPLSNVVKEEAIIIPITTAVQPKPAPSPEVEQVEVAQQQQQQVPEAIMVLAELCNNIMKLGELLLIKK